MPKLDIHPFLCRKDNIGVLIHTANGATASIDAPDAGAVLQAAADKGWRLTHILVTHHHGDHTAGNEELKARTGCQIVGPRAEASRIPAIDLEVEEGDEIDFGGHRIRVLDAPGHTLGHIVYVMPDDAVAFVGDVLFVMGCGRILEGTPELMWRSLQKIAALPVETEIYCGHEYTVANARFGLTVDPDNVALQRRLGEAEAKRAKGELTVPTRLEQELETNVFLRPHTYAIRTRLGLGAAADWRVFSALRELKNRS